MSPVRANPRAPTKPLDKPQNVTTVRGESYGDKVADVTVSVDLVTLIRIMGRRAVNNKTGRAQLLGGAIRVEATNVRDRIR